MWVAALNVDVSPHQGVSGPRQGVLVLAEGNCGPHRGEYGSPHKHRSFNISFIIFTVRTGGRLLPVSVIQGPGHSFTNEDPTIFQEDLNTTCARVSRPRQFPSVSLPTSGAPLSSQQVLSEGLSLSDIQQLHDTTGDILTRQQQQPPASTIPTSSSIPSSSASDTLPVLESGAKICPICQKVFREYNKCKAHYIARHSRREGFKCKKCQKVLGSEASLVQHQETFHKFTNFVCILCQFATSRKAEMSRHMKSHDRWVQHLELRCKYCIRVFHNKDGLHQHLKTCRHNSERPQQQFMSRNPGCGSVFSLLKKRNYHETHRCHLLKKNLGRGRGQSQ